MNKAVVILFLSAVVACNRSDNDLSEHDHGQVSEEEVTFKSTDFTDSIEFFTEYSALIAGQESEVLVHVTLLDTYKPPVAGSVTVSLPGVKTTVNEPAEPGIFLVHILPRDPGDQVMTISVKSDSMDESVDMVVNVQTGHDAKGDDHRSDTEEKNHHIDQVGSEPGEITFLKEQAWNVDFMVEPIYPEPFSTAVKAGGEILAMPGEKKMVASNSAGIVLFSKKDLVQGSLVSKGELLFTISGQALEEGNAGLKYQQYKVELERSKQEYDRQKALYAENVTSGKQLTEARSRYLSDSLRFYNLASTASREGLRVLAPETGYIHELSVSQGQYVETGQVLVTVSTNKVLLLRADVPQQFYYLQGDIKTANFRTAYSDRYYRIEDLDGRLLAKGASVAENDHYLPVYFEVINDGSLLEGAYAEFHLITGQKENRLSVPGDAIMEEQGTNYLYIQVTGETFTKRAIKVGEDNGERVEVLSGLEDGERVVTKGVMVLKAASMVTGGVSHQHIH